MEKQIELLLRAGVEGFRRFDRRYDEGTRSCPIRCGHRFVGAIAGRFELEQQVLILDLFQLGRPLAKRNDGPLMQFANFRFAERSTTGDTDDELKLYALGATPLVEKGEGLGNGLGNAPQERHAHRQPRQDEHDRAARPR
jgi:hypothetical protein